MIQKLSTGKALNSGYRDYYTGRITGRVYRKCHFCKKTITKDQEYLGLSSGYGHGTSMHRVCLLNWLNEHPPLTTAAPAKVLSNEEAEKEFAKIRRKLLRQARSQT